MEHAQESGVIVSWCPWQHDRNNQLMRFRVLPSYSTIFELPFPMDAPPSIDVVAPALEQLVDDDTLAAIREHWAVLPKRVSQMHTVGTINRTRLDVCFKGRRFGVRFDNGDFREFSEIM